MDVKFKFEKKSENLMPLGIKIHPFPLTSHVGLNIVQLYRAACDHLLLMTYPDLQNKFIKSPRSLSESPAT